MKIISQLKVFLVAIVLLIMSVSSAHAMRDGKLLILLVGDSTTAGATPRMVHPDASHLEQLIVELMACEEGMPPLEVINLGKGGETAASIFETGRYDKDVAPYVGEGVDYVFVRYGINDWFKCKDLENDFPADLRKLLSRVQSDFPDAKCVPMTIVPFMPHEECVIINDMIKSVVADMELPLFDIYEPYNAYLLANGRNTLNVRGMPLDKVPTKYHEMFKDRTIHYKSAKKDYMKVIDDGNQLDGILGKYKAWYSDRHPNLAGYHLIAAQSVEYLVKDLTQQK